MFSFCSHIAIMIIGNAAEMYEHGITALYRSLGTAVFLGMGTFLFVPIMYGVGFTSTFTVSCRYYITGIKI